MNIYYAKTILYAYPVIDDIIEQIDELVEKKAFSSMSDYSPAINQCNKIVEYSVQKGYLYILREGVFDIIKDFSAVELDLLDYKYFKKKPKEYYADFDYLSRQYFRRQNRVVIKFANLLQKKGFTDEKFEKEYIPIQFFKELLKRVTEYEKSSSKNKKKTESVA